MDKQQEICILQISPVTSIPQRSVTVPTKKPLLPPSLPPFTYLSESKQVVADLLHRQLLGGQHHHVDVTLGQEHLVKRREGGREGWVRTSNNQ